jgi:APA family basic amino acid/polyamine antiporter
MLGAGIFFVWSPAAALAGWWMLAALVVAAFLAALNALSTTQLAMLTPVAGGAYVFGRDRVSPSVGFVAGTLFLVGKTASVAAIAVVAGGYISDHGRIVPVLLVLALAAVNATGIRSTAWTSAVLAAIVVSGLVASLVVGGATTVPHLPDSALPGGPLGAAQAVALVFFGFAGYARVATLAEEVRDPRRTLPRAVLLSLALVLVLSVATATVLLVGLGPAALATTDSPVAQLVGPAWRPLVVVLAGLAGAGALLGVLAGLSRTALAMARGGDLPGPLVRVWHRTGAPVVAEITVALVGALGAALLDPTALVGVSACAVLGYYGIAHLSALRIPGGPGRWLPRAVPVLGLVGCLVVSLATPWPALLGVVAAVLLALAGRALVRARHRA